ncbi:uncharacterized protein LOC143845495 isoform X2 [Tasmannia lanceolata]|uniref:uncharacterized protein LOC143845495 isoform X2 n=1 Tax=Tasmannia lanceolata TaxID=3420 RepID=UPI0040647C88
MSSHLLSISTTTSLQLPRSYSGTRKRGYIRPNSISLVLGPESYDLNLMGEWNYGISRSNILFRFLFTCFTSVSPIYSRRQLSFSGFSTASFITSGHAKDERELIVGKDDNYEAGFNQIDYLVHILHQSAKTFTIAIEGQILDQNGPQLAKAWVGVDVHAWHKHIAYQAAVYALLQTALDPIIVPYGECGNDPAPVYKILSPKLSMLWEYMESQMSMRDAKLVEWFKMEQLPVLVGLFSPLLRRWSADYATSDIAGVVVAITCYVAAGKLGTGRISCPSFTSSVPDVIGELMNLLHGLVSMDKSHNFASEAGFEHEFLAHFGSKALHHNTSREVIFWIGFIQRKLIVAFHREGVVASLQNSRNTKFVESNLATLGLFAFLGQKTRLFLSCMGIKDLDEPVKDFLSYLECGSLFVYPELSSISVYQLFMEVITEEIGWLEFYATVPCVSQRDRRRSKQHAIQAEKEIILSTVFSVCSDLFVRFGHFTKSTRQSLDANVVSFLLRRNPDTVNPFLTFENVHQKPGDLMVTGIAECMSLMSKLTSSDRMDAINVENLPYDLETRTVHQGLFRKSSNKLISTSSDIWMGTRLLFIDISVALGIFQKQICGHTLTKRQSNKLRKTIVDVAYVIPVAILMLLPVSAVGHAAILAAIKKYIPFLIPSFFSSQRLDVVKQLNRTKKMEVQSWSNPDSTSSFL